MDKALTFPRAVFVTWLWLPLLASADYSPTVSPENIAPTPLTMPSKVEVEGQPRMTKGHPCTLWDQQDIDAIKEQLKTNTELQAKFEALKAAMDQRITQPLGVPEAGGPPPTREVYRAHRDNANAVSNLGTVYVLTGEEKYGEYCKNLLVAYAKAYPRLTHPEGWTEKKYRSAQDGRLTGQFLEDGFWLVNMARGADLVYNVPSWTAEERQLVRDDLFEAVCSQFNHPVLDRNRTYINEPHNRSAMCVSGMLMAGYATDNDKLVNLALYGEDGTAEKPTGGVLGTHFTSKCLLPDGLWIEGAPGYQLGIASCGLMNDAETLWHHGIDLYRHENGILKRLLDSAIGLAYPTPRMDVPLLHDSGALALLDERNWFSQEAGLPYMYGYVRYRDPAYIPIIKNASKQLTTSIHSGPTSLFLDLPDDDKVPPRRIESANYHAVGYGVLRVPATKGHNQLLMEFGPSGSHGHPSKLGIDVFALEDALMPFPGVIFPYQDPMDPKWYWTTLGNCALTVDEQSQITWGNLWKHPRGTPNPEAKQLVFGPAATIGIQRAWSDNLYLEKIPQDRSLFLTANYMADLYAATSSKPRKYDLAWHFRGKMSTDLKLAPHTFPEPVENGYNALSNTQSTSTDQAWSATVATEKGGTARFVSPAGTATEVITGDGHFIVGRKDEEPPTLIQRRTGQNTVLFGSATEFSGGAEPYIRKITQEGGIDAGYGLLKVETVKGTDLCFTAYKQDNFNLPGITTDAQQAFVVNDGATVQALYLGGGKALKAGNAEITRSESGLACVEKLPNGSYLVSNPSPTEATVTVRIPGIDKLEGYDVDRDGNRMGKAKVTRGSGSVALQFQPGTKVEFASK